SARESAYRHGPIHAMEGTRVRKVNIVLQLDEVLKGILPPPSRGPRGVPAIVIVGLGPIRAHTVDVRGTSNPISLDIGSRVVVGAINSLRARHCEYPRPMKGRIITASECKGVGHIGMLGPRRSHIRPSVNQQNTSVWVFRESA